MRRQLDGDELEQPGVFGDLAFRLVILAVLIGALGIAATTAYGSIEDLSGPATAPSTTERETTSTVEPLEPILSTTIRSSTALLDAAETNDAPASVTITRPVPETETTDTSQPVKATSETTIPGTATSNDNPAPTQTTTPVVTEPAETTTVVSSEPETTATLVPTLEEPVPPDREPPAEEDG
jgi:hypothetical protein